MNATEMNAAVPGAPSVKIVSSPFGPIALVWSGDAGSVLVERVLLSRREEAAGDRLAALCPGAVPASCREIDVLAERFGAFLAGDAVSFPLEAVRLDLCTPFQAEVLRAEHAIPRGRVSTYARIAAHIGRSGAARAVGTALARNPFPIVIPCHRAIRSDGTPGGYQGGSSMKRALLEMEGIRFDERGRVAGEALHD